MSRAQPMSKLCQACLTRWRALELKRNDKTHKVPNHPTVVVTHYS
jgi:hypothetical protein